eukprot:15279366-Alexandrium_andersonii.AAC.1
MAWLLGAAPSAAPWAAPRVALGWLLRRARVTAPRAASRVAFRATHWAAPEAAEQPPHAAGRCGGEA